MDSELFPKLGSYPFQSSAVSTAQSFFTVALILTVALLAHLCIYLYNCYRRRRSPSDDVPSLPPPPARLDPSLFQLLPTFIYCSSAATGESSRPTSECSICLAEFEQGHRGRALPNCNHIFHRRCIDRWFLFHSSCPLCRTLVNPPRISSRNTKTEDEEGEFEGLSKENFPPWIGFSRKTLEMIELVEVIVEVPDEDHDRRKGFQGRSNLMGWIEVAA